MEKEIRKIREKGSYTFVDNYRLIFRGYDECTQSYCDIICGNNCEIVCGWECKIVCGDDCVINCGSNCTITCGDNCTIDCGRSCKIICGKENKINCGLCSYLLLGKYTLLRVYGFIFKVIQKNEEHIWWYINKNNLINTFEDADWQRKNPDKLKELYPIVDNELDCATLF